MSLRIDDRVKEDLAFLGHLPIEQFPDFCGIAVEFIRSGSNEKLYSRAAGRVGVAVDVVEKAIVALARVLVDSAKAKLDAFSLGLAISALDSVLSEEACRSLTKFAAEHAREIQSCARAMEMGLPEYRHLDWRLDIEMASRSQHQQCEPTFMLRLDTQAGDGGESLFLQSDYANLKRLQSKLEAATADMKAKHASRISRYIK